MYEGIMLNNFGSTKGLYFLLIGIGYALFHKLWKKVFEGS